MYYLHQNEKNNLAKILDQNGYESSQDLVAVLDTFLASEKHQSMAELQRRLKNRGLNFTPEFVQQALDLFCHYGFAQRRDFEGIEPKYEHRHLGQHHDHLICTRCGRVEEFVNPTIETLQSAAARDKGFIPLEHHLDIYGLCAECTRDRGEAVPLCQAEKGECLVVCGHSGGSELQRRLTDMGLRQGAQVEVLSNSNGPVVVACGGARLALGRGMSEKVLVSPAPAKDNGR